MLVDHESRQTTLLLRDHLALVQSYRVASATTNPKHPDFIACRTAARRRVRKLIKDLRWLRKTFPSVAGR